jgi:hypothetical protein
MSIRASTTGTAIGEFLRWPTSAFRLVQSLPGPPTIRPIYRTGSIHLCGLVATDPSPNSLKAPPSGPYYHIDNHNLLPTRLRFGVRTGIRTGEAGRGHTHAHSWGHVTGIFRCAARAG